MHQTPFSVLTEQLRDFCSLHRQEEKQIAFYGGTFTGLKEHQRNEYFRLAEPFLDELTSLRISTRPDYLGREELDWCKAHRIRTIEIGVQDFSDKVLRASGRGYDAQTAIAACQRVSEQGFELGIQLLPGLPGFNHASFRESAESLRRLRLRYLRLYPLVVLKGTPIWEMYEQGEYTPLTLEEAISICADYHELADEQGFLVIKTGIPPLEPGIAHAGPYHPAFGELVRGELLVRKLTASYKGEQILRLASSDLSVFTGHNGYNRKKLMKRLETCTIRIEPDAALAKGEFRLESA